MYEIQIKELCSLCGPVLEKKEHICMGISPFNSLFSEDYLNSLVGHCQENFKSFHLFIPDAPTVYTLLATGYDLAKAKKKTKKQVNWLKNKIIKSLIHNGIERCDVPSYILDGETLGKNKYFNEELNKASKLFEEDQDFESSCLEASRWVLQNRLSSEEITEERLKVAVKYFLYELPLFAATPKIVGTSSSLFCYHQSIDFHLKLYANKFPYQPSAGQGYGIIQHREYK